ncbi:MAG: hypothetical protein CL944_01860 [Candidatus Diapherotrites archaeon]|uniref:Uncharacterized protein n=1 Tax=Candidatus Iainarchaeum sp. TaxID=3101447 RepID=A0A2D6LPT0_9ARCH|nr:hypothetical protein [Candidatus Diapherotrites archaeon]
MPPTPWAVQPVKVKISASVENAFSNAVFWRNQRVGLDKQMLNDWISGDISYNDLTSYYDVRLKGTEGFEQRDIKAIKTLATEKKQSVDDEFEWNQYISGHSSFDKFNKYVNKRFSEEVQGSLGFTAIEALQTALTQSERVNQQAAMAGRFEAGEIGFDQYREFIVNQQGFYPEGSTQHQQLTGILQTIDPVNKVNELNKLFAQGFWGNPGPDGTYDMLLNAVGYQKSVGKLLNNYSEGSPEYTNVFNLLTSADNFVRQYRLAEETSQAALNRNKLFTSQVNAQATFDQKQIQFENGLIDFDELQAAFDEVARIQEEFNVAESFLQELQSNPDSVTQYPTITLPEPKIPERIEPFVAPPETQQPPVVQPPPTQAVPPVQPGAPVQPTAVLAEGGLFKRADSPEIFLVKEGKLSFIQNEEVFKKLFPGQQLSTSFQLFPEGEFKGGKFISGGQQFGFGPTINLENFNQFV